MKKIILKYPILLIAAVFAVLMLNSNTEDYVDVEQLSYEQNPPIPEKFWIQKSNPDLTNKNLILRVKFVHDETLPNEIRLYNSSQEVLKFSDNGVYPDLIENDYIYATLLDENMQELKRKITSNYNSINTKGYLTFFKGHFGEIKKANELIQFDMDKFDNLGQVEVDPVVFTLTNCETDIKKQNSLLITDIKVVEDGARTYQMEHTTTSTVNNVTVTTTVPEKGNHQGSWTFGTMIKNIVNEQYTNITPKDFLKNWVKSWTVPMLVNSEVVSERPDAMNHLILPWLKKTNLPNTLINDSNWESVWDNTDENKLLQFAPFKLSAISNRIDIRGNNSYNTSINNAGETRFVFSLINPVNGKVPFHRNSDFVNVDLADWKGMNVIFEYFNVQNKCTNLNQFAIKWANLSNYDLENPAQLANYLTDLEEITNTVTKPNSKIGNPNNSALARIRTNEKIFQGAAAQNNGAWNAINWELREYSINPVTHFLELVPVANTPSFDNSITQNIIQTNSQFLSSGTLINWIYGVNGPSNKNKVLNENHNISSSLLAPTAIVSQELLHYIGFNIDEYPASVKPNTYDNMTFNYEDETYKNEKIIRKNISINTCQGCHAGENKTAFTQIRPLGYGEEAKYWGPIPDVDNLATDARFYGSGNSGKSYWKDANNAIHVKNNFNMQDVYTSTHQQMVSPFITGRIYRGINNWQDDELDDLNKETGINSELKDEDLKGFFYVNNPDNKHNPNTVDFPGMHNNMNRFNDLERRKIDICKFINLGCLTKFDLVTVIQKINTIPLPKGSH